MQRLRDKSNYISKSEVHTPKKKKKKPKEKTNKQKCETEITMV